MPTLIQSLKKLIPERSPIRLIWHFAKAFCAALRYGFPARKLTVIGITGTDGKTTTVGMITHILQESGRRTAAASTAFFQIGEKREENETHLTSISPFALQSFLRQAVKSGCEYAVIEVSSHGLVQGRVHYTWPGIAAITNLTPESLDYHGTIQQYQKDKGKLFHMLRGRGTKILNGSDASTEHYQHIPSAETVIYNKQGSDLWVEGIEEQEQKVSGMLHTDLGGSVPLVLNIPGAYNLENAQCAISVCTALGVPLDRCIRALESFSSVPGRLEKVDEGQDFLTFVDFAMTENGYRQVLGALRSMVGSDQKVIVLFGCIGNRMKEKRQTIAQVVSDLADIAIVTSDETYGEDPHAVHEEVWASIDQSTIEAEKVFDRREAIECALRKAQSGDAVICCGMGPFSTFNTPDGPIPWSEKEIIREALRALS